MATHLAPTEKSQRNIPAGLIEDARKHVYEGWNAAQQLSGSTPVENRILGGIDEFFSRADSTGSYSPITDALGSVLALTDSSGNITTQYGYDPFGNAAGGGASSTNVFQYTGRENDSDGLYFYRARYYSPTFGRFISEDPAGLAFGPNLYQYTHDSPTTFTDPLGLWPSSGTFSLGGSININFGFWNFQYSGGFVVDVNGGFGAYSTYTGLPGVPFPGASWGNGGVANVGNYGGSGYYPLQPRPGSTPTGGWHGYFGLGLALSNAHGICDLAGPFVNGSVGAGAGTDVSIDGFGGKSSHGAVGGVGATVGVGAGEGGSVTVTNTTITPLAGRNCGCH
jgi:RHS repeat-associated protein